MFFLQILKYLASWNFQHLMEFSCHCYHQWQSTFEERIKLPVIWVIIGCLYTISRTNLMKRCATEEGNGAIQWRPSCKVVMHAQATCMLQMQLFSKFFAHLPCGLIQFRGRQCSTVYETTTTRTLIVKNNKMLIKTSPTATRLEYSYIVLSGVWNRKLCPQLISRKLKDREEYESHFITPSGFHHIVQN